MHPQVALAFHLTERSAEAITEQTSLAAVIVTAHSCKRSLRHVWEEVIPKQVTVLEDIAPLQTEVLDSQMAVVGPIYDPAFFSRARCALHEGLSLFQPSLALTNEDTSKTRQSGGRIRQDLHAEGGMRSRVPRSDGTRGITQLHRLPTSLLRSS